MVIPTRIEICVGECGTVETVVGVFDRHTSIRLRVSRETGARHPFGLSRSRRHPFSERAMSWASRRARVSGFFALITQNVAIFR